MMQQLLKKLDALGISIAITAGQLDIKAPTGVMTADLLNEIKQHKQALVTFLEDAVSESPSAIPKAEKQPFYPLSSAQYRLWLIQHIAQDTVAYNMPSVYTIKGQVSVAAFEKSWKGLVAKHSIVRTNFKVDTSTGNPVQYIRSKEASLFRFSYLEHTIAAEASTLIAAECEYHFDLENESLLRVTLVRTAAETYQLIVVMHHIISDAWSSTIMLRELIANYQAIVQGQEVPVSENPIEYTDYAVWQQAQLTTHTAAKNYWLTQFQEAVPVMELPTYQPRPAIKTYEGACIVQALDQQLVQELEAICTARGASLFMGLLSVFKILLYRYTGQEDSCIGTPISGRTHPDVQDQIGFYVNTLALRTRLQGDASFITTLETVKEITLAAYKHQEYPFDQLVQELQLATDRSRHPLFDSMFSIETTESSGIVVSDNLSIEAVDYAQQASKFDIECMIKKEGTSYAVHFTYNTALFTADFIERLAMQYQQVLTSCTTDPTTAIAALDYVPTVQKERLVYTFNTTVAAYPSKESFISLFQAQVEQNPSAIAIVYEEVSMTYQTLLDTATALAHYLHQHEGVVAGDCIGVSVERNHWLVIAFIATQKLNAIYLPIDPAYPGARIDFITADSQCKTVVNASVLQAFEASTLHTENTVLPTTIATPIVYRIYTSGTTGQPKGVNVTQQNLLNLCYWHQQYYQVTSASKTTLYAGISFDASIWEMTPYLLAGATLYPITEDSIRVQTDVLSTFLDTHQISHSYLPTAICQVLVAAEVALPHTKVLTGGDTLLLSKAPTFELYNNYGPTECTVVATAGRVLDQHTITIGTPIANTSIYILDEQLAVVPIGVPGKLYIGGDGVAMGYHEQPALTAAKFINNPYQSGTLLYDTGDIVKWMVDGSLVFIGRNDDQIQLRGHRIELGAIESAVQSFSTALHQVVALVQEAQLSVYYTTTHPIDIEELQQYLAALVPSYMLPTYYTELESMPLTPNGKIDTRALQQVEGVAPQQTAYVAPTNAIETAFVAIWQEVLGVDRIGIHDNFFALGGSSLMIGQVLNQLYQRSQVTIAYKDFFEQPTIAQLAQQCSSVQYTAIPPAPVAATYPLTPAQQRIIVLSQLEGGSTAYNMSGAVTLTGTVVPSVLETACQLLLEQHEILRTSFHTDSAGTIYQKVAETCEFTIAYSDMTGAESDEITDYVQQLQSTHFDLAQPPLFKAALLQLAPTEYVLSFVMHHSIGDGWSVNLLFAAMIRVYHQLLADASYRPTPLKIQYKDYVVWLQQQTQTAAYTAAATYWTAQFQGTIPVLEVPTAKQRPAVKTYHGHTVTHRFEAAFLTRIKAMASQHDATVFMALMAGVNVLLQAYTHQQDLIIGTPIAGRTHPDLEAQLGMYVNTLAIRTQLDTQQSFAQVLAQQKELLSAAYEHQHYPFDELVSTLQLQRDTARAALFDVMVIYQNQEQLASLAIEPTTATGITMIPYNIETTTAQFDLSFVFAEQADELVLTLTYNTDIYDTAFIQQLGVHEESILAQGMEFPQQPIGQLRYLTDAETHQITNVFNQTAISYPQEMTLVSLFEQQVMRTPAATAVVHDSKTLTYQQLQEASNQFAHYLQAVAGVQPTDLVAVKIPRSEQLAVVLLGILKTGAAYVPIDIQYPAQRIEFIANDSHARCVVDTAMLAQFEATKTQYSTPNVYSTIAPTQTAYVIYTSGTTGTPKGVMITHRNAVALIQWAQQEFDANGFDIAYAATSHCFDLSVYELFYPLAIGKPVRILQDALHIAAAIPLDTRILINTVPSSMRALLASDVAIDRIRMINLAGEPFPIDIANQLASTPIEVRNLYGPSEDTTYSTCYRLPRYMKHTSAIPIGRPIANTRAYVLNEFLQPVPIGVEGTLYLAGDGVAKGYLNQPTTTAAKFIEHPDAPTERLYNTGDIVKWLPDGTLSFIGRKDHQVKLRGYRIELAAIEHTLQSYTSAIQEVVAIVQQDTLIAYYTADTPQDTTELKQYLASKLPVYMLPNTITQLDTLPVTPNGKIDRKALEARSITPVVMNSYVAPSNAIETQLVTIWKDILAIDTIGVTDNFFELGGHSLQALQVINQINQTFGLQLKLNDFFANQEIASIAQLVQFNTHQKTAAVDTASYDEVVI